MFRAAHQPMWVVRAESIASFIARAIAIAPGARSASKTVIAPARRSDLMLGEGLIVLRFSRST